MLETGGITPFKRVVRHRTTKQYYAGEGKWTPRLQEARDFHQLLPILDEVRKHDPKGFCNLILKFSCEEYDISIPL